jgi:chorismate lyase / 3-hydroxybenzoate synthase
MAVQTRDSQLTVTYGASCAEVAVLGEGLQVKLPMPWLAGPQIESIRFKDAKVSQNGAFVLATEEDLIFGAAMVDASEKLEGAAESTYRELLNLCTGWHLHRVWNYVPQINEHQAGLERYQQFNIGRWVAFEEYFGRELRSHMPAASAVGIQGGHLVTIFAAGREKPLYFENPAQVPAYHYPADYGPRPPGFARGVVIGEAGERTIYLSGTASIEGHRSIGEGDWAMQFRTTMQNIRTMLDRMDASEALQVENWKNGLIYEGNFKCYLRHPEFLSIIQESLFELTGLTDEQVTFVQADICRPELDLEIEATFKISRAT